MTIPHLPVMVREVIEILNPKKGGIYVDATVGLGGHAESILNMIGKSGIMIGIDRDEAALHVTEKKYDDPRLILRHGNFSDMERILSEEGFSSVDGILFDLGVSMKQLRDLVRGFSFFSDERLDMRMDTSQPFSAWDIVNRYAEKDLVRVLKDYGEEHRAVRIARAIVRQRDKKNIHSCSELADIVSRTVGRRGRIHPATKTFQALRIEVNKEMDELEKGLKTSLNQLSRSGRFCVISYHSLEDRAVKTFIKDNAKKGLVRSLTKKPLTPTLIEKRLNASSRSAKLRGAEKL